MNSYNLKMILFAAVLVALVAFGVIDPASASGLALVGAVVDVKSSLLTNRDATPSVLNSANLHKGNARQSIAVLAVANGDSIGSTYRVCTVRSSDRPSSIRVFCTAITSAAANIGLSDTTGNGSAAVSASLFASAQSLASALAGTEVLHQNLALTNGEKRIWELLGLTSDPMKDYDLVVTLSAAATAAGTMKIEYNGTSGE